ncbi:DNA adenine methylase, partial [candidate division TA06 bacterium]
IYFDPPYQPLSKTSSFTSYTSNSFGEDEQRRLSEVFKELDRRGCKVMLSNSHTKLVRKLYKGFKLEKVLAKRAINCKATGRGEIEEYLILNY